MDVRGYVLTIDPPDGRRRQHISRELNDIGIAWQFVEGVRSGDPSLTALYSPAKNLLLCKRSMAPAEVAAYAGHRRIWELIDRSAEPYALVFEDDAVIAEADVFRQTLADLTSGDFDLVKLFDFHPKPVAVRARIGKTQLVSHRTVASGMVCYLISRDAARKLLSRIRIFRAVDEDTSHPWEFGIRVWSVWPNPVAHGAEMLGGSMIETDRLASKKSMLRSVYAELLQLRKKLRTASYHARLEADPFDLDGD